MLGRGLGGTCEVHAWYMRGTSHAEAKAECRMQNAEWRLGFVSGCCPVWTVGGAQEAVRWPSRSDQPAVNSKATVSRNGQACGSVVPAS